MRAARLLPSLRTQRIFTALARAMRAASRRGFRIVHFSVQRDHVHFLVEAPDRDTLTRGVQGLAIRLARSLNRAAKRRGKVWSDRHHRRALKSPREVRNALVYLLMNVKKHACDDHVVRASSGVLDMRSSAVWFDGFNARAGPIHAALIERAEENPSNRRPVCAPRTWLLLEGWRRRGLIDASESPTTS